jgi:uncharacterized protein (DUF2147 family)
MIRIMSLAVAALLALAGAAFAADPLEGTWQTAKDDNGNYGHVEVAPCGDRLCGVLIRSFNASGAQIESDNVGKNIVWDMLAQGGGKYARGKVWSPDRDKTYNSRILLSGDTLTVKGCVLGICRDGGTWMRVN